MGWKLSQESAAAILKLTASTEAGLYQREDGIAEPLVHADPDPKTGERRAATRAEVLAYDNGCNVRMLGWLFDPTGRVRGIGIPNY